MKPDMARRSITATLGEIEQTQIALGVEADPVELAEALEIVRRIEARLIKAQPKLREPPGDAA